MSDFFTEFFSDVASLSDADLYCLLCDACDFNDDDAFKFITAELKSRGA